MRWLNAGLAADDLGIVDEAHLAMRDLAERVGLDDAADGLTSATSMLRLATWNVAGRARPPRASATRRRWLGP